MNIAKNFIKNEDKKERLMASFKCPVCNSVFIKRKDTGYNKEYLCCSNKCSNIFKFGILKDGTFKSKHIHWNRYSNMMQRCYNPKATQYADYGGRGIRVSELLQDFDNYILLVNSLENANKKGFTVDRIINHMDYSYDNIKWSTWNEQHLNKRRQDRWSSKHKGIAHHKSRPGNKNWMLKVENIYIGYFETEEIAIEKLIKVQRLSRNGVHSSEWKQLASRTDEDIVRPV